MEVVALETFRFLMILKFNNMFTCGVRGKAMNSVINKIRINHLT